MRPLFLFAIWLVLVRPVMAEEDDLSARETVQIQARMLFTQRNFNALNALAEQYRTNGERTPAGYEKLHQFYKGLTTYAEFAAPTLVDKPNERQWQLIFAETNDWIKQKPSPAAYIALAQFYINYAWARRGTGTADTVKSDHWAPFLADLRKAHEVLIAHEAKANIDPEWYVAMVTLARAEQWPTTQADALYAEAMQKNRYYEYVYYGIALNLTPLWGGSWSDVDKLANFAADQTKDKQGDTLYAGLYRSLESSMSMSMQETSANWDRMKTGFRDMLKQYPNQWNVNSFAYYACQAQDKPTAKTEIMAIKDLRMPAWNDNDDGYLRCEAWALR